MSVSQRLTYHTPVRHVGVDAAAQARWEARRAAECDRFRREFAGVILPPSYRGQVTANGFGARRGPGAVGQYFRRRADLDNWVSQAQSSRAG